MRPPFIKLFPGLEIKGGNNGRAGIAKLAFGDVVVSNTSVTDKSVIILTPQNATGTIGLLFVTNKIAGVGFTIHSNSPLDTSNVAWVIVEII